MTPVSTINRDYRKLEASHGTAWALNYFDRVDELFDPVKEHIIEYRENACVLLREGRVAAFVIWGQSFKKGWWVRNLGVTCDAAPCAVSSVADRRGVVPPLSPHKFYAVLDL